MFQQKILFFLSVVEKGSFSAAAKKHYLSQSAISQQMIKLETELGFLLFDRTTYRPTLTKAGKYYYEECSKLYKLYQKVEQNARKEAEDRNKILKIGITGPFENKHIPNIIEQYKETYQDVKIEVKIYNFAQCIRMLQEDELDIAFGISNDFKDLSNIHVITILRHHICVVCSKKHPFSKRTSIYGKELINQPIISLSKNLGNYFYQDFLRSFTLDGITPNIIKEAEGLDELFLSVKLNEGIALLAKEVVNDTKELCCLPLEQTHHHADFCVGYKEENSKLYLTPFIHQIVSYFKTVSDYL